CIGLLDHAREPLPLLRIVHERVLGFLERAQHRLLVLCERGLGSRLGAANVRSYAREVERAPADHRRCAPRAARRLAELARIPGDEAEEAAQRYAWEQVGLFDADPG